MDIKEKFYANLDLIREDYEQKYKEAAALAQKYADEDEKNRKREGRKKNRINQMWSKAAKRSREKAVTGMYEEAEPLNELRGKGTLDKKDKEKLKDRIYKKHGKAWDDTKKKRKALGSKGSADTKDMDKFRNRLSAMYNKLEEEQLDEKAKWRKTKVAKKITDPQGYDSASYDYHSDNPKSTGMMKATSDKPYSYGSLMTRGKAKITSKGKVTKSSADKLKDKIKANLKK